MLNMCLMGSLEVFNRLLRTEAPFPTLLREHRRVSFTEVTFKDGDDEGEHEEESEDRVEREVHVQEPFTTRTRGITAVPTAV